MDEDRLCRGFGDLRVIRDPRSTGSRDPKVIRDPRSTGPRDLQVIRNPRVPTSQGDLRSQEPGIPGSQGDPRSHEHGIPGGRNRDQEARLCPDRHLPSCRGMRSRLCSEEGHVSQRRLDDIPCLWPPLCNSLYNSLPPFPVSGEAACTCLEGKPATWAEDITKTARSSPYVVSLLHVSAPSAVSLPA